MLHEKSCVHDLQGTHLINNLALSFSPRNSLSHLSYCSFTPSRLTCGQSRLTWCNFLFLSAWKYTPSHDVPMMLCSTVNKTWSDFSARLWRICFVWDPNWSLSFLPVPRLQYEWGVLVKAAAHSCGEHAAGRAVAVSHILADISDNPLPEIVAFPKWSNLNKTVIQFRFRKRKRFQSAFRMMWIELKNVGKNLDVKH